MPMLKADAIRALGGSISEAARRCRIKPQAVSDWPSELTHAIEDRVVAALARQRLPGIVQDALSAAAAIDDATAEG